MCLLTLGWVAWGALHSLLVSPACAGTIERHFPRFGPYYRLAYNGLAVLTLIPVLVFKHTLAGESLFAWSGPLVWVRWAGLGAALFLAWAGAREYDLAWVGDLKQLRSRRSGDPYATELRTSGILAWVRHPWYGSALLLLWTHAGRFDTAELTTSLVLTAYVLIGARLEERKLLAVHGHAYRAYQARTSMFFPWPANVWTR